MTIDYMRKNLLIKSLLWRRNQENAGFTALEMIVVALMIGVLGAIAAPGWLGFVNRQRVNQANDAVLSALQQAQREAVRTKVEHNVSFKTTHTILALPHTILALPTQFLPSPTRVLL